MANRAIVWFKDITKDDIPLVGGKGANLGEMTGAAIPVPLGFVVTVDAYYNFIKNNELDKIIEQILKPLDVDNSKVL
ncbi:MAG: hypothetical protein IZT57_04335, partial [Chloroflexi bacterium]|nr:hypothetical protein [Chloroflexota bacterium]